jgi:hypothetical protein
MLHGAFTDVERSSNLFVASAESEIMQNPRFPLREFKTRHRHPKIEHKDIGES